jgi:hypothetical protein
MITFYLTDAEIMIARRLLRSIRHLTAVRPSRVCIPPPRPGKALYCGVVIPADIPMRDIGNGPRQVLSNDAAKTAADTVKPEPT